jgi:3-methylfumaryl-CoA hydratase
VTGPLDAAHLRQWIGRSHTEEDELSLFPARGMAALLDREPHTVQRGSRLPPAWHWLYFKPTTPQGQLGDDGHPLRGGFLPPVPLPRRMWAGGRLRFGAPLHLGDGAHCVSTVRDVVIKHGRAGPLVFVTVHHAIAGPAGLACEEEQHIVYRDAGDHDASPATQAPADPVFVWQQQFMPGNVALFRFSALTFNAHRIHYDQAWATEREHYPNVLVHAPLTALLLLDAACRHAPAAEPGAFEYRAVAPLFAGQPITLRGAVPEGDRQRVTASNAAGRVAMVATVTWPTERSA